MEFGEPPAKQQQQPAPDPETDAFADVPKDLGKRIDRTIQRGLDFARRHVEDSRARTVLDQTILSMRQRGLSLSEIEFKLEGQLTRDQIQHSIAQQLAYYDSMTPSEMRALQIARLEDVINMCYDYARGGSDKHVAQLLVAIERLNRMFELETDKTKIEINLITSQQAGMLVALVDTLLRVLLTDPRIKDALEKADVPIEYVDGLTAQALDAAEADLTRAQETVVQLDLKNETAQLVAPDPALTR